MPLMPTSKLRCSETIGRLCRILTTASSILTMPVPRLELGITVYRLKAVRESPNVNKAAPSSTTSFKRKPPEPDKAGKPPRLFSQPGKENRNVDVAKNVQT